MNKKIKKFKKFHPYAVELLEQEKNFLVVAEDEPYYLKIFTLIREQQQELGVWEVTDEIFYIQACIKFTLSIISKGLGLTK